MNKPDPSKVLSRLYRNTLITIMGKVGRMEFTAKFTSFSVNPVDDSTAMKFWMFNKVTSTMMDMMVKTIGYLSVFL